MHPTLRLAAARGAVPPTGPGFDVVLLLHVGCVLVGLVTVVVSGISAARLAAALPGGPPDEALLRYYAPGVNWAGRALHAVPVLGFALVAQSHGAFGLGQAWVQWGLAVWVLIAGAAEGLLWPAERRIQTLLAAPGGPGAPGTDLVAVRRLCRRTAGVSVALVGAIVLGVILMVAQP